MTADEVSSLMMFASHQVSLADGNLEIHLIAASHQINLTSRTHSARLPSETEVLMEHANNCMSINRQDCKLQQIQILNFKIKTANRCKEKMCSW